MATTKGRTMAAEDTEDRVDVRQGLDDFATYVSQAHKTGIERLEHMAAEAGAALDGIQLGPLPTPEDTVQMSLDLETLEQVTGTAGEKVLVASENRFYEWFSDEGGEWRPVVDA